MKRRRYTKIEIEALRVLRQMAGGRLDYYSAAELEDLFFRITAVHRASGPLYMADWRDRQGGYEHLFIDEEAVRD